MLCTVLKNIYFLLRQLHVRIITTAGKDNFILQHVDLHCCFIVCLHRWCRCYVCAENIVSCLHAGAENQMQEGLT